MRSKAALGLGMLAVGWPSAAHAQWQTTTVGGVDVRIYAPAATSPAGEGRALMIILHGCSQTADQIKTHGNLEAAADAMGVVMAVPNVPFGGVVAGCWDYYGSLHSRSGGHNGPIVAMTEAMRDDAAYGIDAAQMYIVGFSSGGGQALILGCVAPDLYAGVGAVAAPGLGSTINEIGNPTTTGDATADLCRSYAAGNVADLATQTAIVFNDANDFTVAQGYGLINTEMFANTIAGGIGAMGTESLDMGMLPGASPMGTATVYSDADGDRLVRLESTGISHNWPAGSGASAGGLTFVSGPGLNFSQYAAEFFAANNVRADGWTPGGDDDGGDDAPDDGGDGGDTGDDGDDGEPSGDEAGSDDDGADGASSADDAGDGGDGGPGGGGVQPQDPDYIEPTGCQCAADRDRGGLGWSVLLLALGVGLRRRRTAARSQRG
ncbi:MAG: PHB depolymerase family esterase [Myxococcota bacterium]